MFLLYKLMVLLVFSPKLIPWFVSDVTPTDFRLAISSLLQPSFFNTDGVSDDNMLVKDDHLKQMVTRWNTYIDEGVFSLSVPMDTLLGEDTSGTAALAEFWTSPWPYWHMQSHAPLLFQSLAESDLVIFKVRRKGWSWVIWLTMW